MPDFLIASTIFALTASQVVLAVVSWHRGYQRGQIDALGKTCIEWKLVDQPDGTTTWEKI